MRGIHHHVPVVERILRVVGPRIKFRHLMKRKVGALRQFGIVAIDDSERESAGGRPAVALALARPGLVAAPHAPSPGKPMLAVEDRHSFASLRPRSVGPALEALQRALARGP